MSFAESVGRKKIKLLSGAPSPSKSSNAPSFSNSKVSTPTPAKLIEKVSPYDVAHEEKSFAPRSLDRWFEQAGGEVVEREFIGLVPMFSPDPLARVCKAVEPIVEALPGLRAIGCAQYMQRVRTPLA